MKGIDVMIVQDIALICIGVFGITEAVLDFMKYAYDGYDRHMEIAREIAKYAFFAGVAVVIITQCALHE